MVGYYLYCVLVKEKLYGKIRKEEQIMRISNAELKVIQVVWKKKKVTSAEIIAELEKCNWNDNTIRTLIKRLVTKKAIGIAGKEGKMYYYISLIDEKKYKATVIDCHVKQLFHGSLEEFLIFLAKNFEQYRNSIKRVKEKLDKEKE